MKKAPQLLLALALLFTFTLNIKAADNTVNSIGVSPASLTNYDLIPGSTVTQDFIISRSNTSEAGAMLIDITSDVKSWFQLKPGTRIELPKGEQRVAFSITTAVPADAALGKYKGTIAVKIEEKGNGDQVYFVPAVNLSIDLSVTNDLKTQLLVHSTKIADYKQNEHLKVAVTIENLGNVASKPDSLNLKLLDLNKNFLKEVNSTDFTSIDPFSTKEEIIDLGDQQLPVADYFAELKILAAKYEYSSMLSFRVLEAPAPSIFVNTSGELSSSSVVLIVFLVMLVIGIAGVFIILGKRKKKKDSSDRLQSVTVLGKEKIHHRAMKKIKSSAGKILSKNKKKN